jgi:hypothetical protein
MVQDSQGHPQGEGREVMSITGATPLAGLRIERDIAETLEIFGTEDELFEAKAYLKEQGYEVWLKNRRKPEQSVVALRTVTDSGTLEA